jgi:hypothetical protein
MTLAAAVVAVAVGGCGGGSSKVSAGSLHSRLLPASGVPGYFLSRTLDWSDPVNLVGEGLFLPEVVHPSQAVSKINGAGFEGASGEKLATNSGDADITTGVMEFKSASQAASIRDWMHQEDLREPCFTACIYTPGSLPLPAVPGSRAVAQSAHAPAPPPPPSGSRRKVVVVGPPSRYLVEFVIGRYLYFGWTEAPPNAQANFVKIAEDYYNRVKGLRA